jgi:stage III sporulation protein AA
MKEGKRMNLQTYLPMCIRPRIDDAALQNAEEIRIRTNHPLEILYADGESRCYGCLTAADLREMLNYLCGYSACAMEEELRQGYFTIEGGHRVGVSGRTSFEKNGTASVVNTVSDISGLNIRIAHEKKGCAKNLIPWIWRDGRLRHTFLFSSPGAGKTTCLRDCIRLLSNGDGEHPGVKVGVVDERSEIAACHCGVPQNDLGPRVDVLDNCPKEQGMRMLLRSMSPEIIAVDELGDAADFAAVAECTKSGVAVLGTIHAGSVAEAREKLFFRGSILSREKVYLVQICRCRDGTRKLLVFDDGGNLQWQGC